MIILRNIKELLNKRIEDLGIRNNNNRIKELIFRLYKERKILKYRKTEESAKNIMKYNYLN